MKRLSGIVFATVAGLAILVGSIVAVTYWQPFAAPPERVAESFMLALIEGNYDEALRYVDPEARLEFNADDLRHFTQFIMMRSGRIIDVRSERTWVHGRRAEATARLVTSAAGEWALSLKMNRSGGSWTVSEIGTIQNASDTRNTFGARVPTAIAGIHCSAHAVVG